MVNGVTICMNSRTSLSTVALLSTLWEKEQRDYLDVIGQFVLRCMPQEIDAKIDISTITAKMRADYGFDDIPYQVVEKVLRRLSKLNARPKRYFRRENRCFYVTETYDCRAFDLARQETNALIRDEMSQLVRTNGGRLSVFRHTVEEASRVLEAYAHKPQSHNSFSLAGLDARGYPSEVLASIATPQAIEENLRQKGILVCDTPSYDPTRIVDGKYLYEGFENEVAIEQQLLKYCIRKMAF